MKKADLRILLIDHDPVGLISDDDKNYDEYDPEVDSIFSSLHTCENADDVLDLVWNVFVYWFGEKTLKGKEHYRGIADEIWNAIRR